MRRLGALIVALAGCATAPTASNQPLQVTDIIEHARQLDGEEILVRGWLSTCVPTACTVWLSKMAKERWNPSVPMPALSIARDVHFDLAVAKKLPATVVLKARVNAKCLEARQRAHTGRTEDIVECIQHRPTELIPVRLIELTPATPQNPAAHES